MIAADNAQVSVTPGLLSAVGSTLKLLRLAHGYSQKDLGRLLLVPRTFVSRLEIKAIAPTYKTLAKYADVFQISLSNLFQIAEAIAHG